MVGWDGWGPDLVIEQVSWGGKFVLMAGTLMIVFGLFALFEGI
jgi:hypothetical protein